MIALLIFFMLTKAIISKRKKHPMAKIFSLDTDNDLHKDHWIQITEQIFDVYDVCFCRDTNACYCIRVFTPML